MDSPDIPTPPASRPGLTQNDTPALITSSSTSTTTPSSTTPFSSTNPNNPSSQQTLSPSELEAISHILSLIYNYRTESGHDPSKLFHRKVNRRVLPDYYTIIQEPMALSVIKAKINTREYRKFPEFVRDVALIVHNAQVYNRPDARAYQDALIIKDLVQNELKNLVQQGSLTPSDTQFPFLGEIPSNDFDGDPEESVISHNNPNLPSTNTSDTNSDSDPESDDPDDFDNDSDDTNYPSKPTTQKSRRWKRNDIDEDYQDHDTKRRSVKPSRSDTSPDLRIREFIREMRKFTTSNNTPLLQHFESLPNQSLHPDYFKMIQQPIAMDIITNNVKAKKYSTLNQFLNDVDTMIQNALVYYREDNPVHLSAIDLRNKTKSLLQRIHNRHNTNDAFPHNSPSSQGIIHNGETWKIGDWVLIRNLNNPDKPIIGQIFKIKLVPLAKSLINVCWYYRPEQTVHRYDKLFYEREVFKTGQYHDHSIDEVIDRCFVSFITRYCRGRPKSLPPDKQLFVCESRYNEDTHKFSKIKVWASCLPDQVRDQDYEMEWYETPLPMIKLPSPISHLLKPNALETDDLPHPINPSHNAPPAIGAVHRRPRDPKDSPPSQSVHSPAPNHFRTIDPLQNPNLSHLSSPHQARSPLDTTVSSDTLVLNQATSTPISRINGNLLPNHPLSANTSHLLLNRSALPNYQPDHFPSSIGILNNFSNSTPPTLHHIPSSHTIHQDNLRMVNPLHPNNPRTPHHNNIIMAPHLTTSAPTSLSPNPLPLPSQTFSNHQPTLHPSQQHPSNPLLSSIPLQNTVQVYHLPDSVNDSIPPEIRQKFHSDTHGRIFFFTVPPLLSKSSALSHVKTPRGNTLAAEHSIRYLMEKKRRESALSGQKRKLFSPQIPFQPSSPACPDPPSPSQSADSLLKFSISLSNQIAREFSSDLPHYFSPDPSHSPSSHTSSHHDIANFKSH